MKRQAMRHPKTERLATVLNLPLYAVWGILEGLWQFAAEYAQTGSLSRFSNDDIARKLTWEKDPNDLINALIECNFLDSNTCCDEHRLLIHDWKDHLQDSVSKFLKRNKLDVSVKCPDMSGKSRDMFRLPRPDLDLDQTRPDQTTPPNGRVIPDSVEPFLTRVGIDDPLTDGPPSKLTQALAKVGKHPARIGGRGWDRIKRAVEDIGGGSEDAYATRLEQAIAAGMDTYESAESWVRQQDWNKAKGNSNGNGNITRVKAAPGKYDHIGKAKHPQG